MLPAISSDWALFLDFDGTLAEIVDDPEAVSVAPDTLAGLPAVERRLGGALAVVSGRPIATIDRVLHPVVLPAAGLHGLERRDAAGRVHEAAASQAIDTLRERISGKARGLGLHVEDKGVSLVLHFRRDPALEPDAEALMSEGLEGLSGVHLVRGKMVIEAKPDTADKGVAVETFLKETPFRGRVPVFVGDDVTDEDGFRAAERLGGFGIKIGAGETLARHRAADVSEIGRWLAQAATS